MTQKVAVVAVHGVGQHAAGASAQAVADLLVGLNSYTPADIAVKSPYSDFSVNALNVPLPDAKLFTPFPPVVKPKESIWTSLSDMFEERRGKFAHAYKYDNWFHSASGESHDALAGPDVSGEFMKIQINEYVGDPATSVYPTCRLEGRRAAENGKPGLDVHVYELRWSDLSSPDNTFVRFSWLSTSCSYISPASAALPWIRSHSNICASGTGFCINGSTVTQAAR